MPELTKRERIQKYGEVFTPQHIVEKMLDNLPHDAFAPETTFLEPACGDGVFVLEVLRRKFARCRRRADYSVSIASVYAMDIQQRNVDATIANVTALCEEHFRLSKSDRETINNHVILCDSLKVMRMMNDKNLKESEAQNG